MLTILIDFSNFSGVKVYFKLKKKVITKGFYCHAKPFYKINYEAILLITKFSVFFTFSLMYFLCFMQIHIIIS